MNNKFLPKTIAAFLLVSASLFAGANPNSKTGDQFSRRQRSADRMHGHRSFT